MRPKHHRNYQASRRDPSDSDTSCFPPEPSGLPSLIGIHQLDENIKDVGYIRFVMKYTRLLGFGLWRARKHAILAKNSEATVAAEIARSFRDSVRTGLELLDR